MSNFFISIFVIVLTFFSQANARTCLDLLSNQIEEISYSHDISVQGVFKAVSGDISIYTTSDEILVYNMITGEVEQRMPLPENNRSYDDAPSIKNIVDIHMQPQGSLLLLITGFNYIIFNYKTGKHVVTLDTTTDTRFSSNANNPKWSNDGKLLAFTDKRNRTLKVYHTETNTTSVVADSWTLPFRGERSTYQWNSDGTKLAVITSDRRLHVYEFENGVKTENVITKLVGGFINPAFYVSWIGDNLRIANNFESWFYDKDLRLLSSESSNSSSNLQNGYGDALDVDRNPVESYTTTKPKYTHPELPDEPTLQYTSIDGKLIFFDYGAQGNQYILNTSNQVLFTQPEPKQRLNEPHISEMKIIEDKLYIIYYSRYIKVYDLI